MVGVFNELHKCYANLFVLTHHLQIDSELLKDIIVGSLDFAEEGWRSFMEFPREFS